MSAHKNIDRICAVITALTIVVALIFCNGKVFGVNSAARTIGYENRLFDRSKVHTFDIVINDWDGFIENCENEEYVSCNIVIDGEAMKNVGIRAKGNTSLSSVKNMDSSRYSFKVEFDQYQNGNTYHGLDKLCLNNIIQDNTYMKDYLAYSLMYDFGVDAPLCSYAYITVNGEDWGLYLAVEAIEDSFLERNYGSNYGDLYKPDAMSFGGGRGNGKDFSMGNFLNTESDEKNTESSDKETTSKEKSKSSEGGGMPDFGNGGMPDFANGEMPDFGDFDPSEMFGEGGMPDFTNGEMPDFANGEMPDFGGGKGGFGMGSDDVKLKYTDDDIDSYSNIFNNAKTPVDKADKKRLINSLKALLEQSDLESTVDVDEVIRYFVVHDFLVNGDSYTGQMIHNYYLYEEDGQLSMIPWDYNLAYGSFMGGNASSSVNSPIDTPVSNGMSDRPMVSWIFDNEEYTEMYHQLFSEFLSSVDFEQLVSDTAALIDKYVEKDPTKFCTYEEFRTGVEAISKFCVLRAESVSGQLDGTIPSTSDGQKADSSALIDTSDLNTSDMGSMNNGGGGFGKRRNSDNSDTSSGNEKTERTKGSKKPASFDNSEIKQTADTSSFSVKMLSNITLLANEDSSDSGSSRRGGFGGGQPPQGFDGERPDFGGQPPEGFEGGMPDFGGEMPEGFDPNNMPDDFDPSNIPDGFSPFGGSEEDSVDDEEVSETEETVSDEAPESGENSDNTERPGKPGGENRPSMGDFSPMIGAEKADNTTAYIMLGVSALVLLIGLGFALKFRR